ncbi:MAG TPA: hypothetical protein PKM25_08705, partial [Candidatus Ozemobacteraceae bacterium]|nr:hypothetical protein [Candidatus Ozemobacteraceae bacterium]
MMHRSRGSIVLTIIGLLSVMLIFAFALSRKFSGRARILAMGDHSAIARYFLESCVGDVLRQLKLGVNSENSPVFKAFRSGTGSDRIELAYAPASAIDALASRFRIFRDGMPSVTFEQATPLKFPTDVFSVTGENEEKKGLIRITCKARFEGKRYAMTATFPFKVVMRMQPLIRHFQLFCDRIHTEQPSPFRDEDSLNVIPVRDRKIYDPDQFGLPLTLFPAPKNEADPVKNGRIFLGSDEKRILLNLVGGPRDRREDERSPLYVEDLWQVSPSAFTVNTTKERFQYEELYTDKNGKQIKLLRLRIPLESRGHFANLGLAGFCWELANPGSGYLGEGFDLDAFLKGDPSYSELIRDRNSLAKGSSLRLHGHSLMFLAENENGELGGFPREIYGNVFARFAVLSFFQFPSGGAPIQYSPNSNQSLNFSQFGGVQSISFKPKTGQYGNYMSRIVSGGTSGAPANAESEIPVNVDEDGHHKLLKAADLGQLDGLKTIGPLSRFAGTWLRSPEFSGADGRPKTDETSIAARITRYFKTQKDFKACVGLDRRPARCWIDGTVYIDERLDLPQGITTKDIRGGTVLVNGPVTLGSVTRGS